MRLSGPWCKLHLELFDTEELKLIKGMPGSDELIVIWFELVILAAKLGCDGRLLFLRETPYTDEMLAATLARSVPAMRNSISTFIQLRMMERGVRHLRLVGESGLAGPQRDPRGKPRAQGGRACPQEGLRVQELQAAGRRRLSCRTPTGHKHRGRREDRREPPDGHQVPQPGCAGAPGIHGRGGVGRCQKR